jgi:hypothetical protein
MATYQVWYMRPEWVAGAQGAKPDPTNLDATHIHLRNVEALSLNQVLRDMQGDVWSPNGKERDLIRDVIVDPEGAVHVVAMFGFKSLGRGS